MSIRGADVHQENAIPAPWSIRSLSRAPLRPSILIDHSSSSDNDSIMSDSSNLAALVRAALAEDLGEVGDLTATYFLDSSVQSSAVIAAREPGVLAGIAAALEAFRQVDSSLKVNALLDDGADLTVGTAVLEVSGTAASMVTAERTALNFLQRLSGVASLTKQFVDAVAGTNARILDTRKTTPGWRVLEKAAVLSGGGVNHRIGLFDMVMVKDNHLLATSGISALQQSIDRLHADHPEVQVEIEVDRLDQLEEALKLHGVRRVLLDNMPPDVLREAVAITKGQVELEASGGITLETIRAVAETEVDFISVGAITHSAPSLDLGFDFHTP